MSETHRNQRGEGGIGKGQGQFLAEQWQSSGAEAVKRLTDNGAVESGSSCRPSQLYLEMRTSTYGVRATTCRPRMGYVGGICGNNEVICMYS